ncbi:MAG: hypothetical protein A2Y31_04980 [Spirochaetes bacterium GWC2_52_13]|nr:MAG: hypothetical protein A2Y31_04980 [Spirochaetes bacterium GWC2_52_13]HCG63827.1 hypothetical protein [Sphaerochaeta sp.]
MKAFAIEKKEQCTFTTIDHTAPKEGEIVVAVKVLGLCGSDLKTYQGHNPMVEYPIIPGHEIACEVVEVGPGVPAGISVGSRGTVMPYTRCGICPACKSGRFNTCSTNRTMGVARPGAARPFMTVHHDDFIPCDGMDYSDIALVEPLSVGRHAANRVPSVDGKLVLLYGLGIIGVGILIELKRLGAKVIVADVAKDKLALALRLGADYALDIKDAEFDSTIDRLSGGMGLDIVFDAVGSAKIVEAALAKTAVAATIVFVGYHTDTIPFNTKPIVSKELSVYGSRNALKADFEGSRDNLRSNPALKDLLVTNRFAFSELTEAFRYWVDNRGSVMKILVDMPEGERK